MTKISHHIPDSMLTAYVAGSLPHPFSVAVASHISFCEECRTSFQAHQTVGGLMLESTETSPISHALKSDILAQLDQKFIPKAVYDPIGIYPGPVVEAMNGRQPRWKALGKGVKQDILSVSGEGSLRLLYIPGGQAVPEHSHSGLELTLILQGSFSDHTGRFGVGDIEVGDSDLEHTPVADPGDPCICLAATDAPLRFKALVPRLFQPLFRI